MDLLSAIHLLNSLLMIALPILLGIFLVHKNPSSWNVWLAGAATFLIIQLFHIPFNLLVLNPWLEKIRSGLPGTLSLLLLSVSLGLSAATFETVARYAMFRWWLKQDHSWQMGVMAGAGHGGIEAILLGLLALLAYFNMVTLRDLNLGTLNLTADQLNLARLQIQAYWALPWYSSLLGIVERIFTIPIHIAASVLVVQAFIRKSPNAGLPWIGLAFLLHFVTDASVAFTTRWGIYLPEIILGALALIATFIIVILRRPPPVIPLATPLVTSKSPLFTPLPIEESRENLENTRYQ